MELLEFVEKLRQEHLFVECEQTLLRSLNEECNTLSRQLFEKFWLWWKQYSTVQEIALASQDIKSSLPFRNLSIFDNVKFSNISQYYNAAHCAKLIELVHNLNENPKLISDLLHAFCTEGLNFSVISLPQIICSTLYGSCVTYTDERNFLQLLCYILKWEFSPRQNPRQTLRKSSCLFTSLLECYIRCYYPCKLFLSLILHEPLLQVIVKDEGYFCDVSKENSLARFDRTMKHLKLPPDQFKRKQAEYRSKVCAILTHHTSLFIESIRDNIKNFPQSLLFLVNQMFGHLTEMGGISPEEVRKVCAEMLFMIFICPAICSPEQYGLVSDMPVADNVKYNLMQIAQIIQMLAIRSSEDNTGNDPADDLLGHFKKDCLTPFLEGILNYSKSSDIDKLNAEIMNMMPVARQTVLLTPNELDTLVGFVRRALSCGECDATVIAQMAENVSSLPESFHFSNGEVYNNNISSHSVSDPLEQSTERESGIDGIPVLVIPLTNGNHLSSILSEKDVVDAERSKQRKVKYSISYEENGIGAQEKRTRFSLSQDQESVITSSDAQVDGSAASSHSVGSVDLEVEQDNLSDMVSANVSGHGTPSVSGRDTPLSQDQDEATERMIPPIDNIPVTVQKSNREDVTERFGKFEIKNEIYPTVGDDLKSQASETWSTDVLGSDILEQVDHQAGDVSQAAEGAMASFPVPILEQMEEEGTASDAWSIGAVASDTSERPSELIRELEQDIEQQEALAIDIATQESIEMASGDFGHDPDLLGAVGGANADQASDYSTSPKQMSPRTEVRGIDLLSSAADLDKRNREKQLTYPKRSSPKTDMPDVLSSNPDILGLDPSPIVVPMDAEQSASQASVVTTPRIDLLDNMGNLEKQSAKKDLFGAKPFGEELNDGKPESDSIASSRPMPMISLNTGTPPPPLQMDAFMRHKPPSPSPVLLVPADCSGGSVSCDVSDDNLSDSSYRDDLGKKKSGGSSILRHFTANLKEKFQKGHKKKHATYHLGDDGDLSTLTNSSDAIDSSSILDKYRSPKPRRSSLKRNESDPTLNSNAIDQGEIIVFSEINKFDDAKRKLRKSLSNAVGMGFGNISTAVANNDDETIALICLLRSQLAEAIQLQKKVQIVHIREALRCLEHFDTKGKRRLLRSLQDDYHLRMAYTRYLDQNKRKLLSHRSQLRRIIRRVSRDREICSQYLISVCVNHFLRRNDDKIRSLRERFATCRTGDEKQEQLTQCLNMLGLLLDADDAWLSSTDEQRIAAKKMLERSVMTIVYQTAMFPNQDADRLRDRTMQSHITTLADQTPLSMGVRSIYLKEAPWMTAQTEIRTVHILLNSREGLKPHFYGKTPKETL